MSRHYTERKRSVLVARTAVLGALVVVFDYSMKFSGLKEILAFPPLRFLKFDFTGIPIVLSLLLLGLTSGATTSFVAFFAILARSGKFVESSMKALAEFSTILGMHFGLRWPKKFRRPISVAFGVLFRVLIMALANLVVQPLYHGIPFAVAVGLSPLVGVFNVLHGCLSMLGGYILYEALIRRIPSLTGHKKRSIREIRH